MEKLLRQLLVEARAQTDLLFLIAHMQNKRDMGFIQNHKWGHSDTLIRIETTTVQQRIDAERGE